MSMKNRASQKTPSKIKVYLEPLRVLALFWVLYNHSSFYGWLRFREQSLSALTAAGKVKYCLNITLFVFCKISVPLFLMISGALLLGKDVTLNNLIKKRIPRFLILIVVVTALNGWYFYIVGHPFIDGITTFGGFLKKAWSSTDFCTYYLFLYVGFLLALPILRQIVLKRDIILYVVVIFIIFREIIPVFQSALNLGINNIDSYLGLFSYYYVCPLLGYYIDTVPDEKIIKESRSRILLGLTGVVIIIIICAYIAYWYSSVKDTVMPFLSCLVPAYIMYLFKCLYLRKKPMFTCVILKVAPLVFGAFLLSSFIQWQLLPLYQSLIQSISSQAASLIWVFMSMCVSLGICALLRLIPFVRKLI